jgi:hypothetical protein
MVYSQGWLMVQSQEEIRNSLCTCCSKAPSVSHGFKRFWCVILVNLGKTTVIFAIKEVENENAIIFQWLQVSGWGCKYFKKCRTSGVVEA